MQLSFDPQRWQKIVHDTKEMSKRLTIEMLITDNEQMVKLADWHG